MVILYSTPKCFGCQQVKEFFRNHKIAYVMKDVSRDDAARLEMVKKSNGLSVPVVDFNGTIIIGFDQRRLNEFI